MEWFALALLIGLAAMISAATLFLLVLVLAALFLQRPRRAFLAVAAGLALGTAPAWAHNMFIARDPIFISAHGGLNFWIGNNPDAIGYPKIPSGLPSDQAALLQESIRIAETDAGHFLPRSAVSNYWSAKASDYITSRPVDWLVLVGRKMKNFWSAFRYDDLSAITPLRDAGIILPGIQFGLLAALGLSGAIFAFRNRKARWVTAAIGLQMIALLPVFVNERYRLSAVPGLLLLSAFFITELWSQIVAHRWRSVALSGAAVAASTFVVSLPPTDPALLSIDDYKAGRRQLIANDFARAEKRLRLAAAAAVPAGEVPAAVAKLFAESAREKWSSGQVHAALMTVAEAARINPADERVRQLRREIELSASPSP